MTTLEKKLRDIGYIEYCGHDEVIEYIGSQTNNGSWITLFIDRSTRTQVLNNLCRIDHKDDDGWIFCQEDINIIQLLFNKMKKDLKELSQIKNNADKPFTLKEDDFVVHHCTECIYFTSFECLHGLDIVNTNWCKAVPKQLPDDNVLNNSGICPCFTKKE